MAKVKTLEELAQEIYNECQEDEPITMDEALEMAKMELGAKAISNYTQTQEPKKEKPKKERKVDEEKGFILDYIKRGLTLLVDSTTIETENEVKLHFPYNNSQYTVTLTKHRQKG